MTESWSQSPRKLSLISDKSQVHGYELQNCFSKCVKGSNHRSVSGLQMTAGEGHHQQSENCFCESAARPWPAAGGWVRKVNICFNNWPCTFTTAGKHQGQRLATLERWCVGVNKDCSLCPQGWRRSLVRLWLDWPLVPRVHMCCLVIFLYNLLKYWDDLDVQVF